MAHVADGDYEMVGTFNGNPLAMAAARAMLCEVATPEAYERIERLRQRAVAGLEREIARQRPGRARGLRRRQGLRGVLAPSRSATTAASSDLDDRYSHAHWLFQHNGGVFLPPWGKIEQWLISVQHDESDIDRFVANFAALPRGRSWLAADVGVGHSPGVFHRMPCAWTGPEYHTLLTDRSVRFSQRAAGWPACTHPRAGGRRPPVHPREGWSGGRVPADLGCPGAASWPGPAPAGLRLGGRPAARGLRPGAGRHRARCRCRGQNNPVTWPIFKDNQRSPAGCSRRQDATLQVYNWVAYVNQAVPEALRQEVQLQGPGDHVQHDERGDGQAPQRRCRSTCSWASPWTCSAS